MALSFVLSITAYSVMIRRLYTRGICQEHDLCTRATIRTIAVSLFTMATWLPNLVTRVARPGTPLTTVYAVECLTYANCLIDPILYVVAFHVIRLIKPLNPKPSLGTTYRFSDQNS